MNNSSNEEVNDHIYLKQTLESERKYLERMLEMGNEEHYELRLTLINKNKQELENVNDYLRIKCCHQWIVDEYTSEDEVKYCNNCGLGYK